MTLPIGNQRWCERRDSYRPAGEVIRPSEYDVGPMDDDTTPKAFVLTHHYSGTFPAARWRFGLYRFGNLVGVAVFSHPCNDKVLTGVFPGEATDSVELGRFVLLDSVPGNAETWFLGRCFAQLRGQVHGVVSFSDPVPRETMDGRRVFKGHLGTIYQAHNGTYLGRGTARLIKLLPNGAVLNDRTIQKIRKREQGWQYATELLVEAGAAPCRDDPREWLAYWLPRVTRPVRHPGNHKYAWAVDRRWRPRLPAGLPYPKALAA